MEQEEQTEMLIEIRTQTGMIIKGMDDFKDDIKELYKRNDGLKDRVTTVETNAKSAEKDSTRWSKIAVGISAALALLVSLVIKGWNKL